jgi:hypothetical protein
MTSEIAASFHEAGHCYVAVNDNDRVTHSCAIYEEDDGWGGNTDIAGDGLDSPLGTAVAIAGSVAEAKRAAIDIDPAQNVITITEDVVTAIFDYVTAVWADENDRRAAQHARNLAGFPPSPRRSAARRSIPFRCSVSSWSFVPVSAGGSKRCSELSESIHVPAFAGRLAARSEPLGEIQVVCKILHSNRLGSRGNGF